MMRKLFSSLLFVLLAAQAGAQPAPPRQQGSASTDTENLDMLGCVRADTAAVATGVADGDRARCIVDSTGRLWVHVGVIDGTVTVTGPLTDAQLRATPVPISGTITANAGSGTFTISGTVTANAGTGNFLMRPDGTVWALTGTSANVAVTNTPTVNAAQSGTWTVQPGNTANTTAWKVDGSAVTQPVSAGSLPLPTGAATSALQGGGLPAALGAGGGLKVDGSGTALPVSGTVTANAGTGTFFDGIIRDGTGDTTQANVTSGRLNVDGSGVTQPVSIATAPVLVAGSAIIGKVGIDQTTPGTTNRVDIGAALPAGTNVIGKTSIDQTTPGTTNLVALTAETTKVIGVVRTVGNAGATLDSAPNATAPTNVVNVGGRFVTSPATLTTGQAGSLQLTAAQNLKTDVTTMNGVAVTMGNGASGTGVQRVTIASDSTGQVAISGTPTVNPGTAANWGVYVEDAGETAGGNLMMSGAVRRDTLASSSGTTGDNSTINTTSDGALWVAPVAATNGGTSTSRLVSAATTNATNLKASAGQLYAIIASNVNASARYIHLYNTAGTPTCNASIINTFIIPGNTAGAGTNISIPPGVAFGTGIGYCLTTAVDGTGSVAANELVLNFFYR